MLCLTAGLNASVPRGAASLWAPALLHARIPSSSSWLTAPGNLQSLLGHALVLSSLFAQMLSSPHGLNFHFKQFQANKLFIGVFSFQTQSMIL